MTTIVIRIDMPPKGIEVTGDGSAPTDDQMREEKKARQEFLDFVVPKLASLPKRPLRRQGNVERVELLGGEVWSQQNHYLLLVSFDLDGPIDWASLVPPGAEVTEIGPPYAPLYHWPEAG